MFLTSSTGLNYLPTVTGYTGGGSTNLDGITTEGVSVPRLYCFIHATHGFRVFKLDTGTAAEDAPSVIVPDDSTTKNLILQ
jgi:hypothetical protein